MTKIIENESLQFEVFEDGSANVVKCETSLTGDLAIPAFVESEGKSYPVVSIGNKAIPRLHTVDTCDTAAWYQVCHGQRVFELLWTGVHCRIRGESLL